VHDAEPVFVNTMYGNLLPAAPPSPSVSDKARCVERQREGLAVADGAGTDVGVGAAVVIAEAVGDAGAEGVDAEAVATTAAEGVVEGG